MFVAEMIPHRRVLYLLLYMLCSVSFMCFRLITIHQRQNWPEIMNFIYEFMGCYLDFISALESLLFNDFYMWRVLLISFHLPVRCKGSAWGWRRLIPEQVKGRPAGRLGLVLRVAPRGGSAGSSLLGPNGGAGPDNGGATVTGAPDRKGWSHVGVGLLKQPGPTGDFSNGFTHQNGLGSNCQYSKYESALKPSFYITVFLSRWRRKHG